MKIKHEPVIVAVGYNRADSLKRLLDSVSKADYSGYSPKLVVSIDYSGDSSVEGVARQFDWEFGEYEVLQSETRLGLRNHIIKIGNFTDWADGVIILEDDIEVAESYYLYASKAMDYYHDDPKVAGISLYHHSWNYVANEPFLAIPTPFDTFFLQIPQSWGQAFTKSMWNGFYQNYCLPGNSEAFQKEKTIPDVVAKWPDSSWLKYFNRYLVESNKYFIYPYHSLTTNHSEVGENVRSSSNKFEVPFLVGRKQDWRFARYSTAPEAHYDVYFENDNCGNWLEFDREDLELDLYGTKNLNNVKRYLISSRNLPYETIHSYGINRRPMELNLRCRVEGRIFHMYDTHTSFSKPLNAWERFISKNAKVRFLYRMLKLKELLPCAFYLSLCIIDRAISKTRNRFFN